MSTLPNNPIRPDGIDPIDAYLDGMMTDAERAAFEARLEQDAELRRVVEFQRQVDQSLVRQLPYQPPAPAPIAISSARRVSWKRLGWIGAIAAVIVLSVITALYIARPSGTKFRAPDLVYRDFESKGWKPSWVCKDDREFAEMVDFYLHSAVVVPLSTPGVDLMGWSFADQWDKGRPLGTPLSQQTLALLTKVDGRNVLVLMDRESSDRKLDVPKRSGLHLFRRTVNGLVLYEVSPLSEPRVLPKAVPAEGRHSPGSGRLDSKPKGMGRRSRGTAMLESPSDWRDLT